MSLKRILHFDVRLNAERWDVWMTIEDVQDTVHWTGKTRGGLADVMAMITDERVRYHTVNDHLSLDTNPNEQANEEPV